MVKLKDFIKTNDIITVSSVDTLSTALSKLNTSHDAAFVFTEDHQYLGVVNPYHCLIRTSYPGNAKVEHCLFHCPKVHIESHLDKVVHEFIESKIHYLPVFDDAHQFIGIVSARRILDYIKDFPEFKLKIKELLRRKRKPLITVQETEIISRVVHLFKQYKISKLVVVDDNLKLRGVLSYYDLIHFLITPRERSHMGERTGNKVHFAHQPVRNFVKTYVLTLTEDKMVSTALHLILEKQIGSVIIVDAEKHPTGIITTRDILELITQLANDKKVEIITKNLSLQSRLIIGGFFNYLYTLPRKMPALSRIKLLVKEEKNGGLFKVVYSLISQKGQAQVIKKEGKNLLDILKRLKHN